MKLKNIATLVVAFLVANLSIFLFLLVCHYLK